MKKSVVFVVLFLILFGVVFVSAVDLGDAADRIDQSVDSVGNTLENVQRGIGDAGEGSFLAEAWKQIILDNPVIGAIDFVLTKFNLVFTLLFNQEYALFSSIWFVILLWLVVLIGVAEIVQAGMNAGLTLSLLVGLAGAVTLSYLGVYSFIVELITMVSEFFGWWPFKLVLWIVALSLVFTLLKVFGSLAKSFRKDREKFEKEEEKMRFNFMRELIMLKSKV